MEVGSWELFGLYISHRLGQTINLGSSSLISEDFVEQPEEKTDVKSAKYSNLSIVEEVRVNCIC